MSLNESSGEIPGWDDESLLETGQRFRGDGTDAGLPKEVRFRTNVARLIRRRMANVDDYGVPSIFFLSPGGPPDPTSAISVPMLDNGITNVESYLWFVGPVAAKGWGIAIDEWNDQAVFDQAKALGVGDVPAILYETRTTPPEARYFPIGLAEEDTREVLRLDSTSVTLSEILDAVNLMYERSLKTPDAQHPQAKLWVNMSKHWPHQHAEARISLSLREGLTGAFPACTVREEQSQPSGRLDLELEEPLLEDPSQVIRHAILELKVLRSFGSTGLQYSESDNKSWIVDGVKQAASYRNDRSARASALCCFDMRSSYSGNKCFASVRKLALSNQVTLRVWHIFASSKALRDHSVPTK